VDSLESLLKELPVQMSDAEPTLASLWPEKEPLQRVLKLRELQAKYIATAVFAKKYKVSGLDVRPVIP
jgi:hypothetical protein